MITRRRHRRRRLGEPDRRRRARRCWRADLLLGGERQLDARPRRRARRAARLAEAAHDARRRAARARARTGARSPCWPAATRCCTASARRSCAASATRVAVRVIPAISSFALACARLSWPQGDVELVSATSRIAGDRGGRRCSPGGGSSCSASARARAAEIARVARERGFGASRLVVLEELGGADERIEESTADAWPADRDAAALHLVALEVRGDGPLLGRAPGLPDDAYEHDGQITKRDVRAITLAALVPVPGQLLWDVGAGSGSVAIEWLRAAPGVAGGGDRARRGARRADRPQRADARRAVVAGRARRGAGCLRRARRRAARRDLPRRRAERQRPAHALSRAPRAGRAPRRQRRHGRGRADPRRRPRRARRAAHAPGGRPRRAARRVHRLARRRWRSRSGSCACRDRPLHRRRPGRAPTSSRCARSG